MYGESYSDLLTEVHIQLVNTGYELTDCILALREIKAAYSDPDNDACDITDSVITVIEKLEKKLGRNL